MELGYFSMPSHPPERGLKAGHDWDLQTLRWLDELGYSEAWIGEHHTAPWEPHPAPDLLIAQALLHEDVSGTVGVGDQRARRQHGRLDAADVPGGVDLSQEQGHFAGEVGDHHVAQADFAGKINDANTVLAECRQVNTQLDTFVEEKFVGSLEHDTGAIAGIGLATAGAAVFHVFEDRQCVGNYLVTFVTLNIGYETDTTGVTLKLGGVQTAVAFHR